LLLSEPATAVNESLAFRLAPSGHFEAVVSGLDDGPGCIIHEFTSPQSVVVAGNSISITSTSAPFCTIPIFPLIPYQVVADLGVLGPGIYQVTWTQAPDSLSAQLATNALAPEPIPTISFVGVLAMMLCIGLTAMRSLTTRSTRTATGGAARLPSGRLTWTR